MRYAEAALIIRNNDVLDRVFGDSSINEALNIADDILCKLEEDYELVPRNDSVKHRKISSLTDEEIKFIVNEIFKPEKITRIKRNKKEDSISCKIYTKWYTPDTASSETSILISDIVVLRNPFNNGEDAIESYGYPIDRENYKQLKLFCFAKGIFPSEWIENNPYL